MCIQHSHCAKCLNIARRKQYQAKICTHFLVARVLSAGLGWARDYQNVLGKVGGSEMQFDGVDVHALDSGENTQCFFGISNAFYEHLSSEDVPNTRYTSVSSTVCILYTKFL